jgi:serine/threonine protein kinase/Tfp pilus assembly protein PilF
MPDDLRVQIETALGANYTIERELGGGGMSRVFLANEIALDRKIVLKVLPSAFAATVMLDRFRREIQLAAKLQHPHIVPLFSAGQVNGIPYFTMPFVNGESLRRKLGRGTGLPIPEVTRILREVASALAYAHQCEIVHRDIKPDNVLLSHGSAMVVDFGVAKAISASIRDADELQTSEGFAIGTPAYMSPEQSAGDPAIDYRSDIYSFGVMAYELLVGSPPFVGRSRAAILVAHQMERPAPLKERRQDIPAALADLVMSCLEKEPRDRPQHASDLILELESGSGEGARISGESAHRDPSIAVLPFANLSGEPDTEYFSDGITDEIISALSSIPSLRVTARTSSFALKGRGLNVREIGEQLNVDSVLEGSVRRAKSRVRINTQLVNVSDGHRLFSERYDRELEDVFAIQEEIANHIVEKLQLSLTGQQKTSLASRQAGNLDAYEHYLRGRYIWTGTRHMPSAIQHFAEALRHDPQYALAYEGLAVSYCSLGLYAFMPQSAMMQLAKDAARRAVELAPDLPETGTSLGWVQILDWDWAGAESTLGSVIAKHPREALAYSFLALLLCNVDRPSDAKVAAKRAYEIDPLHNAITALVHFHAREYGDAIAHCERMLELDPMSFIGLFVVSLSYAHEGRHEQALNYAKEAARLSPDVIFVKALHGMIGAMAGKTDEARAILADLLERAHENYVAPILLSWVYAHLGETELAFECLDRAYEERSPTLAVGIRSPMYDPLRLDPRYNALLVKLGLS